MTPAVQTAIDTLTPYAQSMEAEELNFATSADVSLRVMRAVDNPDVSLDDLARIFIGFLWIELEGTQNFVTGLDALS